MKNGDLADLRDMLSWVVDFNQGQTDQDFRGPAGDTTKHLDRELNLAYRREVNEGKKNASERAFKRRQSMTWTANATTMAVPDGLKEARVLWVSDDTDVTPGEVLRRWEEQGDGSGFYQYDTDTWGWYPAPTSARTLTIVYMADPVWMEQEADKPELIPLRHRELLVWSAAINMHQTAPITDQNTFSMWLENQRRLRSAWWKELARGKVSDYPPPHIRNPYDDVNSLF